MEHILDNFLPITHIFLHDLRKAIGGIRYEIVGLSLNGKEIAVICRIKSTGKLLFITTYALE